MKLTRASFALVHALAAAPAYGASAQAQATAAGESAAPSAVIAVVRGETLRMSDLDEYWRKTDPRSFRALNEQLSKVRMRMLDGLIYDRLIRQEADRLHMSVEEVLSSKAPAAAVTADAIARLFEQSPARQQGVTIEMASPAIESYLRQQNASEARRAYAESLRLAAKGEVRVHLEPERLVVDRVPTDPIRGAAGAAVEIVEFSDFECPYCAQVRPVLDELLRKYAGRVRLVWKDLPLPLHASAVAAASAARCAGEQSKFWEYHDLLFANQPRFSMADLRKYAIELQLDADAFDRCVDSGHHQQEVQDNGRKAMAEGLSATPTVVINGRVFTGVASFAEYERAVLEELERLASGPSASAQPTPRSRAGRGALLGLLVGVGVGVLQTMLTVDTNQKTWTTLLAAGWGAIGAVIGALEGSRLRQFRGARFLERHPLVSDK